MTTDSPARLGLAAQLTRFVAIGVLSALVDFGIYHLLYALGLFPSGAKAISFICGTTTAYLLNRRFTFQSAGGRARVAGFVLLYGTTFAINVGTNALMLAVLPADAAAGERRLGDRPGAGHRHQLRDAAHGRLPRLS